MKFKSVQSYWCCRIFFFLSYRAPNDSAPDIVSCRAPCTRTDSITANFFPLVENILARAVHQERKPLEYV